MFLAILNRGVHQLGIFGLLGGGEDEGGVGGGILRLVLFDGCSRGSVLKSCGTVVEGCIL